MVWVEGWIEAELVSREKMGGKKDRLKLFGPVVCGPEHGV